MKKNFNKLFDKLNSKIHYRYNLGKLTWFRTGGNAKIFIIVDNSNELEIILNEIKNENFYILGSGSNLLIRDGGYDGIILKLGRGFNKIDIIDDQIEVGASILDVNLSSFALKNNITGFEFYSGIPGSIGGAVKMNAGCFGSETKDIINSIEIYDKKSKRKYLNKKNLNLNYRSSTIKNDEIITKVNFNYKKGNQKEISEKINNIKNKRLLSQPIKNKTSGSTFKNPKNFYAAKLIQEAGCKGLTIGDAILSEHHANFIINKGNAKANDIEKLGNLVIKKVYDKFNILLEWEIKIIGDEN